MKINEVKTATWAGKVRLVKDNPKKLWEVDWNKENIKNLKNNNGRVYLITSNKKIMKIGGSQAKGGLISTIKAYQDNGLTGKPSVRTYGIHIYIYEELMKNNEVEIYMIGSKKVKGKIHGLYHETKEMMLKIDFKEIENLCKKEYKEKMGKYPDWNFQENKNTWPQRISDGRDLICKNKL